MSKQIVKYEKKTNTVPRRRRVVVVKPKRKHNKGKDLQGSMRMSKGPAAVGYDLRQKRGPRITRSGNEVTVAHREYVAAVNGSSNTVESMVLEKIRINPGDSETFEWLSGFAKAYEKYEVKKMIVEYVPTTTTITTGQVILVPDYNVNNPQQNALNQVLNNMDSVAGAAWTPKKLIISPSKFNQTKSFLIRNEAFVASDYLLFDPVNVYVGSNGTPDNTSLGQLYISYVIKFMVPSTNNQTPTLAGAVVGTGNWRPDGRPSLTSFVPSVNPNDKWGNYLPNFVEDSIFVFTQEFYGILTLTIDTANGFDASRVLAFAGTNGSTVWNQVPTLDDEYLAGRDRWSAQCQVKAPIGGGVRIANPLIVGGPGGGEWSGRVTIASAAPKWWQHASPYVRAWNVTGPVGSLGRIIGDPLTKKKNKNSSNTMLQLLKSVLESENDQHNSSCFTEEEEND